MMQVTWSAGNEQRSNVLLLVSLSSEP